MAGPVVDILMYHSISDRGGATSIAPSVFEMQMARLAQSGVPVITMDDLAAARAGALALPPRSVVITFDDGFTDFGDVAWPIMRSYGFRPIVYLPTGFIGRAEGWRGIADPPRLLMGWDRIAELAGEGVLFGSHTVSHPDLTELAPGPLADELTLPQREIATRLGGTVAHFAPPYGRASPGVRAAIARLYATSVGTRLASAKASADIHDLPRLEMFYFTDPDRWANHLAGRGDGYLAVRRMMRAVKSRLMRPWRGL